MSKSWSTVERGLQKCTYFDGTPAVYRGHFYKDGTRVETPCYSSADEARHVRDEAMRERDEAANNCRTGATGKISQRSGVAAVKYGPYDASRYGGPRSQQQNTNLKDSSTHRNKGPGQEQPSGNTSHPHQQAQSRTGQQDAAGNSTGYAGGVTYLRPAQHLRYHPASGALGPQRHQSPGPTPSSTKAYARVVATGAPVGNMLQPLGAVGNMLQLQGPLTQGTVAHAAVQPVHPYYFQNHVQQYQQPHRHSMPAGWEAASPLNVGGTPNLYCAEQPAWSTAGSTGRGLGTWQPQQPAAGGHREPARAQQPALQPLQPPFGASRAQHQSHVADDPWSFRADLHRPPSTSSAPAGAYPLTTFDLRDGPVQGLLAFLPAATVAALPATNKQLNRQTLSATVAAAITAAQSKSTAGNGAEQQPQADDWCGRRVRITTCYSDQFTHDSAVLVAAVGEGSYGQVYLGIAGPAGRLAAAEHQILSVQQAMAVKPQLMAQAAAAAATACQVEALTDLVTALASWQFVAIKCFKPVKDWQKQAKTESTVLHLLRGQPNVVELYAEGVVEQQQQQQAGLAVQAPQQQQQPCMIMEFLEGSLEGILLRNGSMPEREIKQIVAPLLQVFSLMQSGKLLLHGRSVVVVHRDLKAGNVLLKVQAGQHMIPKLADFGAAKIVEVSAPPHPAAAAAATAPLFFQGPYGGALTPPAAKMHTAVVGTPLFMDAVVANPRMRVGTGYDPTIDSWSLGILVAMCAAGDYGFLKQLAEAAMAAPGGLLPNYQLYTQELEKLLEGHRNFPQEARRDIVNGEGSIRHFIGSCCGLLGLPKRTACELLLNPWLSAA